MDFFPFRLFGHRVSVIRRRQVGPTGWIFLRNYKRSRREFIDRSLLEAGLENHVVMVEKAFDETGRPLPEKIAVYAQNQEVAALFFQFYAQAKAQNSRDTRASFRTK